MFLFSCARNIREDTAIDDGKRMAVLVIPQNLLPLRQPPDEPQESLRSELDKSKKSDLWLSAARPFSPFFIRRHADAPTHILQAHLQKVAS